MPTAVRARKEGQKVDGKKQSTITGNPQESLTTKQQQSSRTATALSHDQALMSLQQSNQIVKTMLDATFGCMTFVRGLLPEGNFEDVQLQIAAPEPGRGLRNDEFAASASQSHEDSYGGSSQVKGGKGLRIKKIKRGYSSEADKLLDWIDVGVSEAVEKQYLKACVFAVYLDPEDPTNLVEALTINFHYPEIGNSGVKVPQLEIEDSIHNLHIGGSTSLGKSTDSAPGLDGLHLRSIGEVKRVIEKLIKSLVITCQSLAELPARRWVTMRLEYLDSTPQDYKPAFFVDAEKDQKLHYSKRDAPEISDNTAVGHLDTGFHSLSLEFTSNTEFVPRALTIQEEEEKYGGFKAIAYKSYDIGKKRRAEEAALRSDSAKRRVVWSALDNVEDRADIDPAFQDADGEPDSQVANSMSRSAATTQGSPLQQPVKPMTDDQHIISEATKDATFPSQPQADNATSLPLLALSKDEKRAMHDYLIHISGFSGASLSTGHPGAARVQERRTQVGHATAWPVANQAGSSPIIRKILRERDAAIAKIHEKDEQLENLQRIYEKHRAERDALLRINMSLRERITTGDTDGETFVTQPFSTATSEALSVAPRHHPGIAQYVWISNPEWQKHLLEFRTKIEINQNMLRCVLDMGVEAAAAYLEAALADLDASTAWHHFQVTEMDIIDFGTFCERIPTWLPRVWLDINVSCESQYYGLLVDCMNRIARGFVDVWNEMSHIPSEGPLFRVAYIDTGEELVTSADLRRVKGKLREDGTEYRLVLKIKRPRFIFDMPEWDVDEQDAIVLLETLF